MTPVRLRETFRTNPLHCCWWLLVALVLLIMVITGVPWSLQ